MRNRGLAGFDCTAKISKVSKIDPSDKSSTSSDVFAWLSEELDTGESTRGTDSSLSSFSDFTYGRSGGGWLELRNCNRSVRKSIDRA